jgi:hypothetical protein
MDTSSKENILDITMSTRVDQVFFGRAAFFINREAVRFEAVRQTAPMTPLAAGG